MAEKLERELGKTLVADCCRVLCLLGVLVAVGSALFPNRGLAGSTFKLNTFILSNHRTR